MPYPRKAVAVSVLSLLLVIGATLSAGAQTITGAIFGKAVDEGGLPLPGVTVTVESPQLITQTETRLTTETGQYRFPSLPPGRYLVTFALTGFNTMKHEEIVVTAGGSVAVDGALGIASIQETLTVSGSSSLVDLKNSQTQQTFSQQLIENLPNRSFVDAYHLTPGVVDGQYRDITPGASSVNGGSSRNNRLNLEGANINDAAFGYPSTDLSYEIIQEIQVTTAGVSAEFGGASGGVFNVITKSGGNTIAGATSFYYTGEQLQGTNLTDQLKAEGLRAGSQTIKSWTGGASLGGPILKSRLWYFADYQRKNDAYTMIDFPPVITEGQNLYFGKLTAQIASGHRLETLFQGRDKYLYPFIPDVRLKDDKVMRDSQHYNHIGNAKWTGTLNSTTVLEVNGNMSNQHWYAGWPNAQDDEIGYMDRSTGDIFGGIYRGHGTPVRRNTRQMKADVSHFAQRLLVGSHELKGGVSYDLSYSRENRIWGTHGMIQYLFNGTPDRIGFSNYNVNPVGNTSTTSAYIQDQWSLTDRLTLNLGWRFEHVTSWFPATSVGGINFPVQEFPEMKGLLENNSGSPRLGVVYDLFGKKRTIIRSTFGIFYDQLGSTDFADAAPFAEGQRIYAWADRNGDRRFQADERGNLISDSTVPNPTAIDPDLVPSYWRNFTLGFEHELFPNTVVGVTGIFKQEYDAVQTIDAARPFDIAYMPVTVTNPIDGQAVTIYALRTAYQTIPTQRYVTNPDTSDCSFCVDPHRQYKGLEVTFNRRFINNWGVQGSYVFSQAEGNLGTHHRTVTSSLYSNPNNLVNAWGRSTLDRPHQFKLLATTKLPYDILLSSTYVAQSGMPLQQAMGVLGRQVAFTTADSPLLAFERIITVKGEAPGTLRMPFQHLIALRAEKRFAMGAQRHLGLILDLTNLFNSSALNYMRSIRIDQVDYGKGGNLVQPRTARLGLRLQF